jgi:hypothetical protein
MDFFFLTFLGFEFIYLLTDLWTAFKNITFTNCIQFGISGLLVRGLSKGLTISRICDNAEPPAVHMYKKKHSFLKKPCSLNN